ncbi:MAG: M14 family metallopeptidase [Woeseiaceae bacterium]|nr:M14 family metallopeptidase [Woeseiaceae bacterium]
MKTHHIKKLLFIASFISLWPVVTIHANDTMTVGDLVVIRNSVVAGNVDIPDAGDGVSTSIPVTVFNGAKDGPVMALIAGIHGAEYSPILAMQQVVTKLDTTTMSGAVIVVHNANLPAFQGRTIYFGPDDLKNLNRSFPGEAEGSVTERIAHVLTEQVIEQSDYLMDIHSGDANERLGPSYTAYYAEAGSPELREKSRRMTVAFGLDTVVLFGGDLSSPDSQIYTSAQAVALGVPAMDVESGELGVVSADYIDPITDGVISVMRDLDMIPGEATPTNLPVFIKERARVYSDYDGVWHLSPRIEAGQYVHEGTILGTITDYHGNRLGKVTAPDSGILLIVFGTPPVNQGDNIAVIGLVNP